MATLWRYFALFSTAAVVATSMVAHASPTQTPITETAAGLNERYRFARGSVGFDFDPVTLAELGIQFAVTGQIEEPSDGHRFAFSLRSSSTLEIETRDGVYSGLAAGAVHTQGALLLDRPGNRIVIGNLAIEADSGGVLAVKSTLGDGESPSVTTFELLSILIDYRADMSDVRLAGELTISEPWADALDLPEAAGVIIGAVMIDASLEPADHVAVPGTSCQIDGMSEEPDRSAADFVGSDILVADLQFVVRYGTVGDITAFAIATTACNIGTARASWNAITNDHPVIVQNLYRLKSGRLEQIGMSWVKHGFYAISGSFCTPCYDPVDGGQELGVGCSDPYSATLNGIQTNMSPRLLVNPHTGYFVFPWSGPAPQHLAERRLQVHVDDLDPALNPQARYFMQGHYVHQDDCAAGTQNNNASYREVTVAVINPGVFALSIVPSWQTQRGQPAVRAWQDVDPSVVETDIQVPEDGLFILAAKVDDLGTGFWRYEYALQNLNSDRAAGSFSVPLPAGAELRNVGFHDIDFHSGDIQDPTDWAIVIADDSITWSTESFAVNQTANAVRWGTVYNFRFESNARPDPAIITMGLFKPGSPADMTVETIGPTRSLIDCNDNGIHDTCDVSCHAPDCSAPCGASLDCDYNDVPDECQVDCNDNGIADTCDLDDGTSLDCNENGVPDDCETDCNGNTIPDDCDIEHLTSEDCNGNHVPDECEIDENSTAPGGPFFCIDDCDPDCDDNGVPDECDTPTDDDGDELFGCDDLCPDTDPGVECACGAREDCCFPDEGVCYSDMGLPPISPASCLAIGGVPDCNPSPLCRDGCLVGDCDDDGRISLRDVACLQGCLYSDPSRADYAECQRIFDFDRDGTVDLTDYQQLNELHYNGLP